MTGPRLSEWEVTGTRLSERQVIRWKHNHAANAKRRALTRERHIASLRLRRLARVPKDVRVLHAIVTHGFDGLDRLERERIPMSYAEVGASLGITLEAVRQIEARALAKVRRALGIAQPTPERKVEVLALEALRRSA